ncbi:hypothetical protein TNCV_4386091 [Trichonephila clavipes]|nr:hypothetical protein TNCV_4386091 [Trichonephila clavipes]
MDICKCIVPLRHEGTLNIRRAESSLVSTIHQIIPKALECNKRTLVVKIYRFWNSGAGGAGGARRLRRMQTKEGGSPPGSEPGRWFVIDKGFGALY